MDMRPLRFALVTIGLAGCRMIVTNCRKRLCCVALISFLVAFAPQLPALEIKEDPWEYVAIKLTFRDALSGVTLNCSYGSLVGRSGGAKVCFESQPRVNEEISLTEDQLKKLHSTVTKFFKEYKLRDTSGVESDTLKQTFSIAISIPETAIELRLSYGDDPNFLIVWAVFGELLKSFSPIWFEKVQAVENGGGKSE